MYESIKNFNQQFLFQPEIVNGENLSKQKAYLVVGMGGSALAPLLLKTFKTDLNILIYRDYDIFSLPEEDLRNRLIILSSYSGNTEEVIDAFSRAKEKNFSMAIITTGGKLLSLAKENKIPYIELPNTKTQPRLALGLSIKAFLKLFGEEAELKEISKMAELLKPEIYETKGKELAQKIKNCVPVIYASDQNLSLAYNWKIKINETGKIPAFYNTLPELNHNEMTGFDVKDSTKELSKNFYFIILKDMDDNLRILERMKVLDKLFKDRGLKVETIELAETNKWLKIFAALILADWVSYYSALEYGLEPEQVPMVEEFKKLILEQ